MINHTWSEPKRPKKPPKKRKAHKDVQTDITLKQEIKIVKPKKKEDAKK
jgi:hypothetical protein